MVRAYYDKGWNMLEELKLTNTEKVFNATCYRGIQLCAIGEVTVNSRRGYRNGSHSILRLGAS